MREEIETQKTTEGIKKVRVTDLSSTTKRGESKHLTHEKPFWYMLHRFLFSRIDTGLEPNYEFFDEDVNVYLAHLLNAHIDWDNSFVRPDLHRSTDYEVHKLSSKVTSYREKSTIYRVNADFLLMRASFFDASFPFVQDGSPHDSRQPLLNRAALYYQLAANYKIKSVGGILRRIEIEDDGKKVEITEFKDRSLSDVLTKLSIGISSYAEILSYLAKNYLGFTETISPGELFHLDLETDRTGRVITERRKVNEFLDFLSPKRLSLTDLTNREIARMIDLANSVDSSESGIRLPLYLGEIEIIVKNIRKKIES